MATPRRKKTSRVGPQQTNRYFHVLVSPLRLLSEQTQPPRKITLRILVLETLVAADQQIKEAFELYDRWLSLSPRERQITYLTCEEYKMSKLPFRWAFRWEQSSPIFSMFF